MPSNSDWLYEQCRRDNALDEGVHLTCAHALQIAGELKEQASRLDSLRQNLAVAYSILNDAMAEQDYHVDVSRTAVWLASNEGVVERHNSIARDPASGSLTELACAHEWRTTRGGMIDHCIKCPAMRDTPKK